MQNKGKLKMWKSEQGITTVKLAELLGITVVYADYLVNRKRAPSPKLAFKIHILTGINILDLIYPFNC